MARPVKRGLDYFPFDTDFFSDVKIKRLRAEYGADGLSVYLYLLCVIYRNGYYTELTEDLIFDVADETRIPVTETKQIITSLLSRSLFDNRLAKSVMVLSAASVQRRYQEAVKQRALKNPVTVNARFWLLPLEETQDYISVCNDEDKSVKKGRFSGNNTGFSGNNPPKENKRKVNESKVNTPRAPEARERADAPAARKHSYDVKKFMELAVDKTPYFDENGVVRYR